MGPKVPIWATVQETEMWEYIAWHLAKANIKTFLVGGAVVSVYSDGAYASGDLDFVILSYFEERIPQVMESLGFEKVGMHYRRDDCPHLFVQFVSGPVGIGDDLEITAAERLVSDETLYIYSPTDCVRDRLAAHAFHNGGRSVLDQALLVALAQPVEFNRIERWCKSEKIEDTFKAFKKLYNRRKRK